MGRHHASAVFREAFVYGLRLSAAACAAAILMAAPSTAQTTISWDGGGGSQWWYSPANWDGGVFGNTMKNDRLPPQNSGNTSATPTVIMGGTSALSGGEGVVYDPSNADPNWANLPAFEMTAPFPATYGPQIIQTLRLGERIAGNELLTVKGSLQASSIEIGRSTGLTDGVVGDARINQLAGTVLVPTNVLNIGSSDNTYAGRVNGTYDYRGGTLSIGANGTANAVNLAGGSASLNSQTNVPIGPGGNGRLIIRNPATPGYVRFGSLRLGAYRGATDTLTNDFDPNGSTTGVSTLEFHYANGGTRPIQNVGNLTINNGFQSDTRGTVSSRLDLRLDSAVTLNMAGTAPINLGLVDVDFDDPLNGSDNTIMGNVTGLGALFGAFSNADGSTHLTEGTAVSAIFGAIKYNWKISYHGLITWTDIATSAVTSVEAGMAGVNKDVVLLGHSIEMIADDANFDMDDDVDGDDFLIWQRGLGGSTFAQGDANHNGVVDGDDLEIWRNQFGLPPVGVAAAAAVPEPASASMALLTGILLTTVGRRRL